MSANLLELQEMLRNLDMGSVQRVAAGQSGKAAQLLGMDEIKRRGEQMQEAKANQAEQQMQQPPMVDQYLAMSQQVMGQPVAPPPMMPAPPQQGIGSMMPPQAPPQMAAAPPPPQMASAPPPGPPAQKMASGGTVGGGMDLMNRPKMGNMGIVEYLVSTGMSREEAMAMADSIVGGDQSNALKSGGFIQKYQDGGGVEEYGDIFSPIEEELADEDPSIVSELMDWIGENPGKVAALTTAGSLLIPGGLAIRGLSMGAKALLPRILPYLSRGRTAVGALGRRAGMTPKIDPRLRIPERMDRAGRVYRRPGEVTEAIDQQLGRELTSVGLGRAAGAGTLGGVTYGLASLMGSDGEEFVYPGAPFPLAPEIDGPGGEGAGETGPDPIERAEVPVGEGVWQSLIALGAGIAGDERGWGPGIGRGLEGALGTWTAAQERAQGRADKQFEQDLIMEDRPLRQALMESEIVRNLRDPYAGRGALTENQVKDQIAQYLQTENIMPMNPDYYPRFQELFEIFKMGGSQALYAAMGIGGGGDDTAEFLSAVGMQ